MKLKSYKVLIFVLCLGCSKILNPYNENFDCQSKGKDGKCADTSVVYRDLRSRGWDRDFKGFDNNMTNAVIMPRDSVVPLLKPAEVIRVLFLPFTKDGELFMSRYVYLVDTKPHWVVGK